MTVSQALLLQESGVSKTHALATIHFYHLK